MIVEERQLPGLRKKHARKKVVLALGSFDLLHYSHVEYLQWCKKQGDILVVAVNSDREIRTRKGEQRPIIGEQNRIRLLDALRVVNYTVLATWESGPYDEVSYRIAEKLSPAASLKVAITSPRRVKPSLFAIVQI